VLVASLGLVAVLMSSMALPWYSSAETPNWTPFSRWLDVGWLPGSQNWGFLVFALSGAVAGSIGLAIATPRNVRMTILLSVATVLVVATLLEVLARTSVDPGPNLHAAYGAWVGGTAAVLAWVAIASATCLARRHPVARRGP
jgi:hypothetical protein